MNANATVATHLIPIAGLSFVNGFGFITIDVPNGWDDVKQLTKKILKHDGKLYRFTGWNSDYNNAYFREVTEDIAEIVS